MSKAFGLISRFSEDIDITVFRDDLGQHAEPAELEALTGRGAAVGLTPYATCSAFIQGGFATGLRACASEFIPQSFTLEADPDDPDGQSLLPWYPTATARADEYIRSAVKIESGAKSALDPHTAAIVTPYLAEDLPHLDLQVRNVTTVQPERTLWDKLIILHGLRLWYERRGELRHGGQRVSRHYYDVHQLLRSKHAADWLANRALADDCARHARLFFGSSDLGLDLARPETFTLITAVQDRKICYRSWQATRP